MSVEAARERIQALEQRAYQLALDGHTVRQIADHLGLGEPYIRAVIVTRRAQARRCLAERCGQPQTTPGHPRRGWVQVRAGSDRPWFCSLRCAHAWLAVRLADASRATGK